MSPHIKASMVGALVAIVVSTACVDEDPTAVASPAFAIFDGLSLAVPLDSISEDEPMMAVARVLPQTFGGFWYRPDGSIVVGLTDTRDLARAEVLIRPWLGTDRNAPIVAKQVEYPFLELAAYRTLLARHFFGVTGAVGIGVSESGNRLKLYVASESAESAVRLIMDGLGIPPEATVFTTMPRPSDALVNLTNPQPHNLAQGGWQIMNRDGFGCTVGFTAIAGSTEGFVTNSHCTVETATLDGDSVRQSYWPINPVWGKETIDPPTFVCLFLGNPASCRHSDSAFFKASVTLDFARIARTVSREVCDNCQGSIDVDTANPIRISHRREHTIEGMTLDKIGRTSGWTAGVVSDTCFDFMTTSGWVKLCSDRVDMGMDDGDSGSPVFSYRATGNAELVGIAYASNPLWPYGAFISDLHQIEKDLGSLKVHDPIVYASIEGASSVPASASCDWFGYAEGQPPYTYEWRRDGNLVSTTEFYDTNDTGTTSFELSFKVTDSRSHTITDYLIVDIDPNDTGFTCTYP